MPIEKFDQFPPPAKTPEALKEKQEISLTEKIKQFKEGLISKAQEILGRTGIEFNQDEARERVEEINPQQEGEEDMFAEIEADLDSEPVSLRLLGQYDEHYDPEREKDYDKWDLTPREEAERWLRREIIINQKLNKFLSQGSVSADQIIEANHDPRQGDLYLLKRTREQHKDFEQYGEQEGRAIARTLLDLQKNLKATKMIQEIMAENQITSKLELEQKIFEDYFDHFEGYQENTQKELGEMEHEIKHEIATALTRYEDIIKSRQLEGHEYSLAHGGCYLDKIIYTADGRALLSDWKRAGTTQNRELSLVYDLGDVMNGALENLDSIDNIKEFIRGIEEEIKEHYQDDDPRVAEAVINLTKFRSLAMVVDGLDGEKKEYALAQLKQAIEMSENF